jgi:hypothetical protein
MKRCYRCKWNLPLFMFGKAVRFTIPTDKGRNRTCRVCTFKAAKDKVVRWKDGKFSVVKLSLTDRIKEFFK